MPLRLFAAMTDPRNTALSEHGRELISSSRLYFLTPEVVEIAGEELTIPLVSGILDKVPECVYMEWERGGRLTGVHLISKATDFPTTGLIPGGFLTIIHPQPKDGRDGFKVDVAAFGWDENGLILDSDPGIDELVKYVLNTLTYVLVMEHSRGLLINDVQVLNPGSAILRAPELRYGYREVTLHLGRDVAKRAYYSLIGMKFDSSTAKSKRGQHDVDGHDRHLKSGKVVKVAAHKRGDPNISVKTIHRVVLG